MTQQAQDSADRKFIPRPETVTTEYLRDILDGYYLMKWNPNKDTVAAVSKWKDWPLVVRMPDVKQDFTILIDRGHGADRHRRATRAAAHPVRDAGRHDAAHLLRRDDCRDRGHLRADQDPRQ